MKIVIFIKDLANNFDTSEQNPGFGDFILILCAYFELGKENSRRHGRESGIPERRRKSHVHTSFILISFFWVGGGGGGHGRWLEKKWHLRRRKYTF